MPEARSPQRRWRSDDATVWADRRRGTPTPEERAFVWAATLATIDTDLAGKRVLDAGCNRGGFLRLLAWLDYYYDRKLLLRFRRS